ncbi:MAG: M42 family metallopeptidase [Phycisphaeraceae bacterium]
MKLLERLCLTPAIPGREERIRELILKETKGLFDETHVDAMGSLVGVRKPRMPRKARADKKPATRSNSAPTRIMLAAHMDQIGFMVRHIESSGFVRIAPTGGFDPRNLFARLVTICTDHGDLPGVLNPGVKPVHIASEEDKKKTPELNDFVIDLGLSADQVKDKVQIGDMVVLQAPFVRIGKTIVSQCLDNRVASWIAIEALRKTPHHACEIHCAFTVQEEVGLRGAGTAAYAIKPDIGIAIDTTLAVDTPGVSDDQRVTKLGDGAGITLMDASMISDLSVARHFESLAKKHKIKHQRSVLPRGGTDAGAMQRAGGGARVFTLSCPTRYIHTVTEMVHEDDLHACRDVLAAYLADVG